MIVEIALGIVLAIVIIVVGLAALAALVEALPAILSYGACIGSLLLLTHFLGGWGLVLWFPLIIGFIGFLERDEIFNQAPQNGVAAKKD